METYQEIPLKKIKPSPFNPRLTNFEGPDFDELVASIRQKGVIQPILLRPNGKGYEIVAGERRYRASLAVNPKGSIPALVRKLSDAEAIELMTVENLQRADLTELEEAQGFKAYLTIKGEDAITELSERVGLDVRFIRRRIAVLGLPQSVLNLWHKGDLSCGHLEQFLRLDPSEREETLATIMRQDYYGRAIRTMTVAELKDEIDRKSPQLPFGLFKKADCAKCASNSSRQRQLFGDDFEAEKALCQNTPCFTEKQRAWLKENWAKTSHAKEHKTRGFVFSHEVNYDQYVHNWSPAKKCLKCDQFVTVLRLTNQEILGQACLDKSCKAQLSKSDKPGKKNDAALRSGKHGVEFREKFYQQVIPERAAPIAPDDAKVLRLALAALLHSNRRVYSDACPIITGKKRGDMDYMELEKVWHRIETLDKEKVLEALKASALAVSLQGDFGHETRNRLAAHLGIDLSTDWRLNEEYLKKKTIAEIQAIADKFKFWDEPKARLHLTETCKQKSFSTCRKKDLIDVILNSGIDLAGKVPDEILRV